MFDQNTTFAGVVGHLIGLINQIIPVLVSMALALFLWGGIRFIYKSGDAKGHGADKEMLLWGLVAMFVMVSIWGILALLREAFAV